MNFHRPGTAAVLAALVLLGAERNRAAAQTPDGEEKPLPVRTQTIALRQGWNAVWLEVDPLDADPDKVFAGLPVEVCARYFRPVTSMRFVKSPSEAPWNEEGWGVWHAPDREEAVLKSLHRIEGGAGYLIQASASTTWNLPGKVRHRVRRWSNDAYNLTGFSVDASAPPTFAAFFAGAGGKTGSSIYRLIEGRWQRVENPAATAMRSGEACWILAAGDVSYQGPLRVDLSGLEAADFGALADKVMVTCVNASAATRTVTAELVPAASNLPVRRIIPDLATLTAESAGSGTGASWSLGSGFAGQLQLQVRREEMAAATGTALLRFSDGAGTCVWVPVRAQK